MSSSDAADPSGPTRRQVVARIANAIRMASERRGTAGAGKAGGGPLSPGDVAELRRMGGRGGELPPPAFWKVVALFLEPLLLEPRSRRGEEWRRSEERQWAALLAALAWCRGAADLGPGARLGEQLARCDVGELRFQALMRARDDGLRDMVMTIAQLADSRGRALHFGELADLVLDAPDSARGIGARRRVARSYYAAQYKKQAKENAS